MKPLQRRPARRNGGALSADDLPLFAHAASRERHTLPLAVRRLAARFDLSPSLARTVADLAGFAEDRS